MCSFHTKMPLLLKKAHALLSMKDPFWNYCQSEWDELLPVGDISDFPAVALQLAESFLKSDAVKGVLDNKQVSSSIKMM